MDREAREERDRTFNEMLREKYEANRGGLRIEDLLARRREQENDAPAEQEGEQE